MPPIEKPIYELDQLLTSMPDPLPLTSWVLMVTSHASILNLSKTLGGTNYHLRTSKTEYLVIVDTLHRDYVYLRVRY